MSARIPEKTPAQAIEELALRITAQRDAMDVQIAALRQAGANPAVGMSGDLMIALYLSAGSAMDVVRFADLQGWRLPSKKGPEHPPRRVSPVDVYALLRGDRSAIPPPSSPTLALMARQQLESSHFRGM